MDNRSSSFSTKEIAYPFFLGIIKPDRKPPCNASHREQTPHLHNGGPSATHKDRMNADDIRVKSGDEDHDDGDGHHQRRRRASVQTTSLDREPVVCPSDREQNEDDKAQPSEKHPKRSQAARCIDKRNGQREQDPSDN